MARNPCQRTSTTVTGRSGNAPRTEGARQRSAVSSQQSAISFCRFPVLFLEIIPPITDIASESGLGRGRRALLGDRSLQRHRGSRGSQLRAPRTTHQADQEEDNQHTRYSSKREATGMSQPATGREGSGLGERDEKPSSTSGLRQTSKDP